MVVVLIDLNSIASGNVVVASIIVKSYPFPFLLFDIGPTQSINTLKKGSSMTGKGQRRATGIVWLGLTTC